MNSKQTPVYLSIVKKLWNTTMALVEAGADPMVMAKDGTDALSFLVNNGNFNRIAKIKMVIAGKQILYQS